MPRHRKGEARPWYAPGLGLALRTRRSARSRQPGNGVGKIRPAAGPMVRPGRQQPDSPGSAAELSRLPAPAGGGRPSPHAARGPPVPPHAADAVAVGGRGHRRRRRARAHAPHAGLTYSPGTDAGCPPADRSSRARARQAGRDRPGIELQRRRKVRGHRPAGPRPGLRGQRRGAHAVAAAPAQARQPRPAAGPQPTWSTRPSGAGQPGSPR